MATADCATSIGFRCSAEPGTTNSVSCATLVGFASAASPVAWAGNRGSRNVADWLPRIDERVLDPRTGFFTPRWYNYFRELGARLGGVQGPSVTQVVQEVAETRVQVAANTVYTEQAVAYTTSVAQAQAATAEVAQNSGLSGAGSIPAPGHPPSRPNYHVE